MNEMNEKQLYKRYQKTQQCSNGHPVTKVIVKTYVVLCYSGLWDLAEVDLAGLHVGLLHGGLLALQE